MNSITEWSSHIKIGTFFVCTLCFLAAVGVPLTKVHTAAAQEPKAGCSQNPKLTTDQYSAILGGDIRNNLNPIFKRIPADVAVVDQKKAYIVINDTSLHDLPSNESPSGFGLRHGYRFTASCRAKGASGEWWLVTKSKDGYLNYLPEKDAEIAADYDKSVRKEIEERQKP